MINATQVSKHVSDRSIQWLAIDPAGTFYCLDAKSVCAVLTKSQLVGAQSLQYVLLGTRLRNHRRKFKAFTPAFRGDNLVYRHSEFSFGIIPEIE